MRIPLNLRALTLPASRCVFPTSVRAARRSRGSLRLSLPPSSSTNQPVGLLRVLQVILANFSGNYSARNCSGICLCREAVWRPVWKEMARCTDQKHQFIKSLLKEWRKEGNDHGRLEGKGRENGCLVGKDPGNNLKSMELYCKISTNSSTS